MKKHLKQALSLLLSLALVLGLAACGGGTADTPNTGNGGDPAANETSAADPNAGSDITEE